jgi:hypothetical protein
MIFVYSEGAEQVVRRMETRLKYQANLCLAKMEAYPLQTECGAHGGDRGGTIKPALKRERALMQ